MTDTMKLLASHGLSEVTEVRTFRGYHDDWPVTVDVYDRGEPGPGRFAVVAYQTGLNPDDLETPHYRGNPAPTLADAVGDIIWGQVTRD